MREEEDSVELLEPEHVLADVADEWVMAGPGVISRTHEFGDFPSAVAAVAEVAALAEGMDHHPDIDIRWRTVTFRCSTHSAGGLTELDVALAQAIDGVIAER